MEISNSTHYIKAIISGFINSLSKKTLDNLYQDHIEQTKQRNQLLLQSVSQTPHKHYLRKPAATLEIFITEYLESVIILKLCNSSYAKYFTDLSHTDIAYLLSKKTTVQNINDIEQTVFRLIKRPKNIQAIRSLFDTFDTFDEYEDIIHTPF